MVRLLPGLCIGFALSFVASGGPAAEPSGFQPPGSPLTDREIENLQTVVFPDGTGLPRGSGNAAAGKNLFAQRCAACHGPAGRGGPAGALVADPRSELRTVTTYWPYATTLFDYVRRAMPYDAPGSLEAEEVYAVVAYILSEGNVIPSDERLDKTTLPRVVMPGRQRFP